MSEQISKELLKIMNEISENEAKIAKINASVFVRNCQNIVKEKVAYLYSIINVEAKNCFHVQNLNLDEVNFIISDYNDKLNMVYDEFYCQYASVQSELQEAKINRRIAIINYQKIINQDEKSQKIQNILDKKLSLKNKNEIYKQIIDKCNLKLNELNNNFEKIINQKFVISSNSLKIFSEQNIFQRTVNKVFNMFNGKKKYKEILEQYSKMIKNIDSNQIVEQMRNDTIEFVADILEIKESNGNGLNVNVRIGGNMDNKKIGKKTTVKEYLEGDGKELGEKMQKRIDDEYKDKDKWKDFTTELSEVVYNYANAPTERNKDKMKEFVLEHFNGYPTFASEALEEILKDLKINNLKVSEKTKTNSSNDITYKNKINKYYKEAGLETPDEINERFAKIREAKENEKYGIVKPKTKENEGNGIVKSRKIKGVAKKDKVSKEKTVFYDFYKKLNNIIERAKEARTFINEKNAEILDNVPEDIKNIYNQMMNYELNEEGIENFENTLEEEREKQVENIRESFEKLKTPEIDEKRLQNLRDALNSLLEGRNYSEEDRKKDIDFVLYSTIKRGKLVVPPHSVFKEIFNEKNIKSNDSENKENNNNSENEGQDPKYEIDEVKKMLYEYILVSKISDLSNDEILNLGKNFNDLEKMESNSKEYIIAKIINENETLLPDNKDEIMEDIKKYSNEYMALEELTKSTEFMHKVVIAEEIKAQCLEIDKVVKECEHKVIYERNLEDDDIEKRNEVLKIAKTKVEKLRKAKISEILNKGIIEAKDILEESEKILCEDLKKVKEVGRKKLVELNNQEDIIQGE